MGQHFHFQHSFWDVIQEVTYHCIWTIISVGVILCGNLIKLIKIAAEIISPSLTEIFAKSISTGIFPSEWKTARVSPIFKKGKKNDPNNYRPISVIPAVAKIFEKVIFEQLYNYFNICYGVNR